MWCGDLVKRITFSLPDEVYFALVRERRKRLRELLSRTDETTNVKVSLNDIVVEILAEKLGVKVGENFKTS